MAADTLSRVKQWIEDVGKLRALCESPIEEMFFDALLEAGQYEPSAAHNMLLFYRPDYDRAEHALGIIPQKEIVTDDRRYRADFLILGGTNGSGRAAIRIIVELDGHEFHERTKEQASRDRARDRALADAGYTVLRFTGSDVYRDPAGVANQVIEFCERAIARTLEDEHA